MKSKQINVLLVDDEEEFVHTLAERLALRGYATRIAGDGESGINMVSHETVDVVLLDLMMPGLSGLDTLKQLKNMNQALPVILLTGHGSTKDAMAGMRIGAFDFLIKPLDINELTKKIQLAVDQTTP